MDRLRKIFTIGVVVMTVLAMSSVVVPGAKAAASAGDLIKIDGLSSVYYLGADGKRYVFPNEATYFSWYSDFSSVVTIPQSEMESYPLKANVTMRSGTKLVKSPSNPKVYAVEPSGVLRAISSEANAIALYGADWAKKVVDVVDSFFTNYTVGSALPDNQYPAGQLFKMTASADVYYLGTDGKARKVANEGAFSANRFDWGYIETAPATYVLTAGTEITGVEDSLKDTSQGGGGTGTVSGTGLTVALASDTPASATIPQNASVEFLKLNLTAANDGDVDVTGIKLTAGGLGTATNIDGVALYNNGMRIGNIKDVDSANEAYFNLSNPLKVEAGSTESVTVRAKVSAGTNQHLLGVKAAADVTTNGATVSGSFPVNGNVMSVASVTVGTLTISIDGTPTNPDLGATQATIAKLKLENGNVENITFNSIVLKRSAGDAADDDFENIKLLSGGSVVATSNGLKDKWVTFTLETPMLIEKGKTKKFEVTADVVDGAGKTVTLSLNNVVDVNAIGMYYGQPSLVSGTFAGTSLTIQAGEVSLAKVNAVKTKVRADQTNVDFGTIKITNNSNAAEMTTLKLTVDAVSETKVSYNFTYLENVEVYDKTRGITYELTGVTGGDSDTAIFSNTDMGLYFTAGETKELVVRADILSSSTVQKYTVKVNDAANDIYIKESANETEITDITPNSISLAQITVQNPAVTFSVNSLASETVVVGKENVTAISLNVEANETDDLKVTELKFTDRDTDTMTSGVISSLSLYKGETLVSSKSGSNLSSEEITFGSLTEVVSASKKNTYTLKLTFVNDSAYSGTTTRWYMSGYSVEDKTEGDARYDTTADDGAGAGDASDGVIHTAEAGYALLSSGKTITLSGAGNLLVAIDNTVAEANKDKYVVAGTQSDILAAVKMRAENEPVVISDFTFYASTTVDSGNAAFKDMVSTLYLLDSDKTTVLAEETVSGATTTFDNLTLEIGATTKILYVKADFINIGKGFVGVINSAATVRATDIVAEGKSSGTTLADAAGSGTTCASGKICWDEAGAGAYTSTTYRTAASKEFKALAAKISNVELVSSAEGQSLDTSINGTGWIKAAIIKVTTDASSNTLANGDTLKMVLEKVKVKVEKNTDTQLAANGVSIERLGSGASGLSTSTADDVTGTSTEEYGRMNLVDDSTIGTDEEILPGSTVYFLVKVNVGTQQSGVGNDWVRVSLDLLDGTADAANGTTGANLKWKDGSDANAKYPLRLSKTKIDGTKIVEPS